MAARVGQQCGEYRLLRLLGRGGFSEVYLGEHVRDKTLAAVKMLNAHLTAEKDLREFINEARTFRLKHPHIAQLLDFGIREDGVAFLIMAYAPKGTLRHRHPLGTLLSPATIISYVKPIAAALQYAHDQRLIHRDVKPENMLVGPHDEIWLSDFGLAVTAHSTRSHVLQDQLGTVCYMAPEQIQGKPQPASDQYALGIVVYEWLTGTYPFTGSNIEITFQHVFAAPAPLQTHLATISPGLERVVLRALSKDPHQRFASVQAFAHAFEQVGLLAQQASVALLSTQPLPVPAQARSSSQTKRIPALKRVVLRALSKGP